ncbi:MAG: wax ester/triacylglycerol synthase family O-acyltransferase [Pseudomonadota bacterium]
MNLQSKRVDLSELSWLAMETRDRPMHVATLLVFSLPKDAAPDYLNTLVASLRDSTEVVAPFNQIYAPPRMFSPMPSWVRTYDPDLEYHVRHLALPSPGGERELGMLIARLHSNKLDFKRPLWEYHLIEGLEGGRFAIYFKMHHSLVDGVAGVRMLQRSLSKSVEEQRFTPLWSGPVPREIIDANHSKQRLRRALSGARRSLISFNHVRRELTSAVRAGLRAHDPLVMPFQANKTIFNGRIGSQRRFATQQYDLARLKRLAKAAGCTLNDIVLAISAGALRQFLKDQNALPGQPLIAGIPVSLRPADDQTAGSAVSYIMANLATHVADPVRRLEVICASTRRAKEVMKRMSRDEIENFTALTLAPALIASMLNVDGYSRPAFNVNISNVPGPSERLYMRGSRLEAMYPVSGVTHGQALNITCYSYAGTFGFGFAGCRDSVPSLQRLAVSAGKALEELEATFLPEQKAPPSGDGSKSERPNVRVVA